MKVIKNYFYTASYQLLAILIPMITAPYVSRTIGPTGAGINAFTNSIVSYFLLIANLGINYYGNREIAYVRDNTQKLVKTFWEIQILRLCTVVFSIISYFIFIAAYNHFTIYLIIQSINLFAVFFDVSWLYMGVEDFKYLLVRNLVIKILSLILIFSLVHNKNDLGIYIFLLGISTLLGNITLWPKLHEILHKKINIHVLKPFKHFKPMFALFIPTIATQLYIELNKTMLGIMVGTDASGYYTYSDNIIKMLLTLITSVGTVMLPHVANAFSNGENKKINKMLDFSFNITTCLSIPMCLGIISVSPKFSILFYGRQFGQVGIGMQYEAPVIIFITWSTIVGMQYLIPLKKESWFTNSAIIGAVSNILLNIPFISIFHLKGAMISTVISELLVSLYQFIKIRKLISLPRLFCDVYKYILASILMFYIIQIISNKLECSLLFNIIIQAMSGLAVYGLVLWLLKPNILKRGNGDVKN